PQANSWLIGCTKKPSAERGPKPSMPIAQPQRMMTAGVRQVEKREPGPSSPTCVDMHFLICRWRIRNRQPPVSRLMQMHENPKSKILRPMKDCRRSIALQEDPARRARRDLAGAT